MTAPNEKPRETLTCPRCGAIEHVCVEKITEFRGWTIAAARCDDCDLLTPFAAKPWDWDSLIREAIAAWDRRTPPAGDGGCPTAWMRLHITPGSPDGPAERDYDFVYGDVEPEGDGWVPLYTHPAPAQAVGISEAQIQALEWCVKIATETPYPKDVGVTRETFRTARACLASLRAAPSEDAIPDVLEHIVGRAEREAVPGSALDSMCKEVRAWLRGEGV